ncbi:hypothetical protein CEXT_97251 [Caerostris extrusa]|uniref:Uncharacterized protein n=1 Tax=Caerostris extrusa TaxID=172846 RepID=A0AAV4XYH7_CAEEX|nr:hypothetical protein CEXT_97251 [Caerostris extrusa]
MEKNIERECGDLVGKVTGHNTDERTDELDQGQAVYQSAKLSKRHAGHHVSLLYTMDIMPLTLSFAFVRSGHHVSLLYTVDIMPLTLSFAFVHSEHHISLLYTVNIMP